jgi:hypothetical protein
LLFLLYKEKQRRALLSMVRITRMPPPDPPTRTERSVRRNETREAQERERDVLAALAALEIENSTTGTGRFDQVMSPTSQPERNNQETDLLDNQDGASAGNQPLQVDIETIRESNGTGTQDVQPMH